MYKPENLVDNETFTISQDLRTCINISLENKLDNQGVPNDKTLKKLLELLEKEKKNSAIIELKDIKGHVYSSFDIPAELREPLLMYVIKMFVNETQYKVLFHDELQSLFGVVSTSSVEKIFQLCKNFYKLCTQNILDYILDTEDGSEWTSNFDPISFDFQIDNKLLEKLECHSTIDEASNFNSSQYIEEEPEGSEEKFNKNWFYERFEHLQHQLTGLSAEEFYNSIIRLLKENKSETQLQNDLVDMLGFESLDFIEVLICQRNKIIKDVNEEEKIQSQSKNLNNKAKPKHFISPMSQVFVLSEKEKMLGKQFRKFEKKNLSTNSDGNDKPEELKLTNQYNIARMMPILASSLKTEKLPYVFNDETLDYKTRAVIGNNKVLTIPVDAKKKDHVKYEEITIPASRRADLFRTNSRLPIKELDPIGQMVFQGVESLNHIQTIVFDTAYQTNENMLVCAPTGAGKTNIALLTIIHQIKNYIRNGIVHRDMFKIVYICPMKALAAEMVKNFSKKLSCVGVIVRELTGDMQLTRKEIIETQMIITTPEKWDVITRKGTGDSELASLVKLIIFDEVHLLNTERGPVIEALVARTLRQVISSQRMIRLVGLSATLPNYLDVAHFLRVNNKVGLFFFDSSYRSVPLQQTFIGIKSTKTIDQLIDMDDVCYDKVIELLEAGHQAMVFVHARNMTTRTGLALKSKATNSGKLDLFLNRESSQFQLFRRETEHIKHKLVSELLSNGIGVHHAGMLRSERNLVEKYFLNGELRVIVCTATLAWGVNLPAHGVIIKGTQLYSAQKSCLVDLDILDVLQIFGRAGRPQFDKSGHGTIITTHDKMHHYLSLLTNQCPIESKFLEYLADNLNAEIVLGTVTNVIEAVEWLTFTYLYRRIRQNPLPYGISFDELQEDPMLKGKCLEFIKISSRLLDKAHMIRYNEKTGDLSSTHIGRIASYYYIKFDTIELFNEKLDSTLTEAALLNMMTYAVEFQQIQIRNEEFDELSELYNTFCEVLVPGGAATAAAKINILMQTYLSRGQVRNVSLMSDMEYIAQNVVRITRALFEIALHRNLPVQAGRCLMLTKMFEVKMWDFQTPLRQFNMIPEIVLEKIESKELSMDDIREFEPNNLGQLIRDHRNAKNVIRCAHFLPQLEVSCTIQPITRGVLRIKVFLLANFTWNDTFHGKAAETFWLWVEDAENDTIYHWECFSFTKANVVKKKEMELVFTVALYEDHPSQYLVRITSDKWLGSLFTHPLSFQNLTLPSSYTPHTDLLELQPLQTSVLQNPQYEALYSFSHFNPIQTQIFHPLYHSDCNVLLGAPTGSGKTIAAELCIFRLFNTDPDRKVVYIAPLKALVRERVEDWKKRFEQKLNRRVVEVTGDVTPSFDKLMQASIIITTPEKWDGMSRSWQTRNYVKQVGLIIIDEIHLLGQDRGAVLEVIVSRTNYIASNTNKPLRIIGLSTAMANAGDLASWLNIEPMGLFNFRPTVRPVPLEVHISGFPGKHYCPRMISMNKPAFKAIRQYAPTSPTIVFVSSRRQTRLTALELIAFIAVDLNPKQWMHEDQDIMESIISSVSDTTLKHSLAFGIGIHHGGLQEGDRKIVESLFLNHKIQILIATATLAWGVNFPAHLVVIKGTEYFDTKVKRYVDMPITDVLQMMGRAGRPQFDDSGVACVFVHDVKKNFYKKFLYEPFPVESNLLPALPDHINAEIVAGNVGSRGNLLEYITWTFFFRRLMENPTYYKLPAIEPEQVNYYLNSLSESIVEKLVESGCIYVDEEEGTYEGTFLGQVSSLYYLSHKSVHHFDCNMKYHMNVIDLIGVLCNSEEYATFSMRHDEDKINLEFNKEVAYPLQNVDFESPHVKANLLLQAHFSHLPMPNPDYYVDLRSVMDQSLRILQAMIDISANKGWLACTLHGQILIQMIIQGEWHDVNPLCQVPALEIEQYTELAKSSHENSMFTSLPGLIYGSRHAGKELKENLNAITKNVEETDKIIKYVSNLPFVNVDVTFLNENETIKILPKGDNVIKIRAGNDYNIQIDLFRTGSESLTIQCSKFSKHKEESWVGILGYEEEDQLLGLKRFSLKNKRRNKLMFSFTTPARAGNYILTFYLLSDSYLGLDQQYDIKCKIYSE